MGSRRAEREVVVTGTGVLCHLGGDLAEIEALLRRGVDATYDGMLDIELDWMRRADLNVHLNEEEYEDFRQLLPEQRHALIYPAVPEVPRAGGKDGVMAHGLSLSPA